MPASDHRDHIGKVEDLLLLNGVDIGSEAKATVPGNTGGRKIVSLRKLPSKLRRKAMIQGLIHVVIELVGITHSGFIHHAGADVPHIGNLRVIAVLVVIRAADRAYTHTGKKVGEVALGIGNDQPVARRDVVIQPPENIYWLGLGPEHCSSSCLWRRPQNTGLRHSALGNKLQWPWQQDQSCWLEFCCRCDTRRRTMSVSPSGHSGLA